MDSFDFSSFGNEAALLTMRLFPYGDGLKCIPDGFFNILRGRKIEVN